MLTSKIRKPSLAALGCLVLIGAAATLPAASVSLTGSDSVGTSSFNSAGKWSDVQAPSAANDYFTGPYFLRTPADGVDHTFAGHSLTLQQPGAGGARSIIFKGSAAVTLTIDNLTNATGGILENGGSGNVGVTYAGNLFTIAGNSAVDANQGPINVNYPLAGASGVILTNAGGNATGITYNGDNSAFKGKFYLSLVNFGNGGGATTVILNAVNGAPGNPSTPTPDQFLLEAGCTLQDNVGLTFNNPNGGITLAGNGTINAAAATTMAEPIIDITNGVSSVSSLTKAGAGTLILSAPNNYSGGTVVSAGTLQIGVAGALPVGTVTANGTLDLNGINTTIGGLNGSASGVVDTANGGTVTLTLGANNASGTFSGSIQNSVGTLNLIKTGTGTQSLSGGYAHSGSTVVAGGRLNVVLGVTPAVAGDIIVTNGAVLAVDTTLGSALPAQNIVIGPNGTLDMTLNPAAIGLNGSGTLTLQNNATNKFHFGSLTANPTAAAVNVAGSLSAPGTGIVLQIDGSGFQAGTFALIDYTGTALANLNNFTLITPPNISATLSNNTANTSIDINISFVTKNDTWYGSVSSSWDFSTFNWRTNNVDTFYQQYTNGPAIVGDGARFDDTLYNDFINPQATNINLTATFYPYPLVVDSTLPYSISGAGGIAGTTSLVKSNTGPLLLSTVNSYSGGTYVYGGSLGVANDSALGAAGAGVTLGGGTLEFRASTTSARPVAITSASSISVVSGATAQLNGDIAGSAGLTKINAGTLALTGNNTVSGALFVNAGTLNISGGSATFTGNPSYVAYQTGTATLNLSGSATLNSAGELRVGGSDVNGTGFDANGIVNMSGGTANLNALTVARGNNNQNSCAGEVNLSAGTLTSTNDVLVGFAGTGKGTLRISGTGTLNVGTTVTKWLRFGQWDSTSGEITISGGNLNLNQGTSIKFNQNNSTGPKTFNQNGGAVTFYSDFATTIGGGGDLDLMLTGTAAATNTYNLNGGTLTVPWVRSSGSTGTRIFNFNGGTLKATRANSTFLSLGSGNSIINVRNGGAIIDDNGFSIAIAQALVHSTIPGDNATDGGLTKQGSSSLTLSGANTFNGPITVNGGSLLMTTASTLSGNLTIGNNATLSIAQVGSATNNTGTLTFNGGATLGLALTAANNPAGAFVNCGTLTLNGNNTISLAGSVKVGTITLIKALGAVAGSGTVTNLLLPQGAVGTISSTFDGTYTTISAVITSTGPGLVWTGGTNNLWDINVSTNWLLNSTVTTYQQTIIPGDLVTFNDSGSGSVILRTNVGPAGLTISNNSKAYTFSGNGTISGPSGLLKLGAATAVLNLTNNSYSGDTVVSNGTIQLGSASAISSGNLSLGASGMLQMAGFSTTVGELVGGGVVDNSSGVETLLTVGTSSGGTWNGTVTNSGGGGVALHKVGAGTWAIGGNNYLNNGQSFTYQNQINQGTVIINNGALLNSAYLQMQIANGTGQTGTVVVAGGTLRVTNNVLSVGYGAATANGTLIVNSGTVDHSGLAPGTFAAVANSIDVGAQGATGTLIVNGGQVLNDQPLFLGDGTGASGTLQLNGGLVRASVVQPNGTPTASIANFNGGTLQAATNSTDFILSTANVQAGGLVLDDGGFEIHIATGSLAEDPASPGGGLIKKGAGTVYLDSGSSYTGTTIVSNGMLAGVGTISGPVLVAPAGTIGGGSAGAIGMLSISGQPLTIQGNAFMRITVDGGVPVGDQISGFSSVAYGGTLIISNATSDATLITTNDTFQLFSSSAPSGNFTSIVGSPGTGLAYRFDPASGILSVTNASSYPPQPPPITFGFSGGTLTLSWPSAYSGYIVQVQTNSLATGLSGNWIDIVGSGSATFINIPVSASNPTVFYRLRKP